LQLNSTKFRKMNHKIYLGSIKLNNYASFAGEKEFDLRDENGFIHQWTVILGNNNTGKTNFLKAIAGLEPFQYSKDSYAASYYKNLHVDEILIDFEYPSFLYEFYHDIEAVGNVFKKQLKKTIKGNIGGIFILDYPTDLKDLKIYGYGVSRRHGNTGLAAKEENYNSITIFENDISLINIEEWLLQLDYATKNNDNIAEKRLAKLEELIKSEIFPEIIDVRFKSEAAKNYVEFQTLEGWYQLHELGYGYQTTLSWLFDLSKKLFERYPDSDNPLKEPAIVLIDEIDLHLHPKWQRNIIKYRHLSRSIKIC